MTPEIKPDSSSEMYADAMMRAMREPLLVLDGDLRVKAAIRSFYETFKSTRDQTLRQSLFPLQGITFPK